MDRLNPNTQTYQPKSLPEREAELDQLHSALRTATMGSTPLNAFVFGPTGQGKTVGISVNYPTLLPRRIRASVLEGRALMWTPGDQSPARGW